MGVVVLIAHAGGRERLVKTGPAAATGELGIGPEQGIAADSTIVIAFCIGFIVFATKCVLGALIPGDIVHIRRKYFFPLGIADVQMGGICAGIVWVVSVVCHSSICLLAIARPGDDRSKNAC